MIRALLPEATDLWLSPAEKRRQRLGLAGLYLLRLQALRQWEAWCRMFERPQG